MIFTEYLKVKGLHKKSLHTLLPLPFCITAAAVCCLLSAVCCSTAVCFSAVLLLSAALLLPAALLLLPETRYCSHHQHNSLKLNNMRIIRFYSDYTVEDIPKYNPIFLLCSIQSMPERSPIPQTSGSTCSCTLVAAQGVLRFLRSPKM